MKEIERIIVDAWPAPLSSTIDCIFNIKSRAGLLFSIHRPGIPFAHAQTLNIYRHHYFRYLLTRRAKKRLKIKLYIWQPRKVSLNSSSLEIFGTNTEKIE